MGILLNVVKAIRTYDCPDLSRLMIELLKIRCIYEVIIRLNVSPMPTPSWHQLNDS